MIVKNEENNIDRCLNSIYKAVDEIIIIDTGSNDKTKDICLRYTNKIYDFKWINDFSKARNYGLKKANYDYILWLDADDYLTNENLNKLINLKNKANDDVDFYYFLYDFDKNYSPFYRERLFKKNKKAIFKGKVHEVISPFGKIKYINIVINQYNNNKPLTNRNLLIYESNLNKKFSTRDLYYYARELFRHQRYDDSLKYLNKFIKRKDKYIEDYIDACILQSKVYCIKKEYQIALKCLFDNFTYDIPRVNTLIEIANIYFNSYDFDKAIYYYKLSLNSLKYYKNKGFIYKDYLGYYQSLSLCVCYFYLKKYKKAFYYNELAHKLKNDNPFYLANKNAINKYVNWKND